MVNETNVCKNYSSNITIDETDDDYQMKKAFKASLYKSLFSVAMLHIILSLFLYLAFNIDGRIHHLKVRSRLLILSTVISVFLDAFSCYAVGFIDSFPAWVYLCLNILVVPLIVFPVPVKLFNFYGRYVFSRAVAQAAIDDSSDAGSRINGNHYNDSSTNSNTLFVIRQVDQDHNKKQRNVEQTDESLSSSNMNIKQEISISVFPASGNNVLSSHSPSRASSSNASIVSFAGLSEKETALPSATDAGDIVAAVHHSSVQSKDKKRKQKLISTRELLILKFIASPTSQAILLMFYLSPFVILIIYNFVEIPELNPLAGCIGLVYPSFNDNAMIAAGIVAISIAMYVAYSVRNFYDPFGIVTECRQYAQYGGIVAIVGYILYQSITDIPYWFTFYMVSHAGMHMMLFTSTTYQIYVGIKKHNNGVVSVFIFWNILKDIFTIKTDDKSTKSVKIDNQAISMKRLNSQESSNQGQVALQRMLDSFNNPKELEEFEKFLIGEFSVEMLRMYLECKRWEKNFFDSSEATRRARAKKIIEHFVEPGSIFEVNIPGDMRNNIIKLCNNSKVDVSIDLFTEVQNEMLLMMEEPFSRFEIRNKE